MTETSSFSIKGANDDMKIIEVEAREKAYNFENIKERTSQAYARL